MEKNKSNIIEARNLSRAKKELEDLKSAYKELADEGKIFNDLIIEDEKRVTAALKDEHKKQLDNWKSFMQQRDDEIKKQNDNLINSQSQKALPVTQAGAAYITAGRPGLSGETPYDVNLLKTGTYSAGLNAMDNSELFTNKEAQGQAALPGISESQKKIADQIKTDYDEDMKSMQTMVKFSQDINQNLSKGGNDFLKFIQEALQDITKIFQAASQEGGPGFGDVMGIIGSALPIISMGLSLPDHGNPQRNIVHTPNNYGRMSLSASVNLPLRALTIGINNENAILSRGSQ